MTANALDRVYRVTAVMQWPVITVSPDRNGLQATFETRIYPQMSNILGFQFSFGAYPFKSMAPPDPGQDFDSEPAALKTKVTATSIAEAANRITDPLFLLVDDLAFQLQKPLPIQRLDIVDITPPVTEGELREASTFHGFDPYRRVRTSGMSEFEVAKTPILRNLAARFDSRIRDALDWYMKGLDATNDPDRFIFFWVAFEILVKLTGTKVEEPTRLRCQHSIPECPTCGKPTSQYRQWATNKAVLLGFGVAEEQADQLWKVRQMVHGARSFGPDETAELYEGVHTLRNAVFGALKKFLAWAPESLPRATGKGLSIHRVMQTSTPVPVRDWELND